MGKAIDLSTKIGGITLKNPVIAASGTAAFGTDTPLLALRDLGGIVLKTVTPEARQGNPPPRVAETASGMINAIGLENPGLEALVTEHLPLIANAGCAVIVSIYAEDAEEIGGMVGRLKDVPGVDVIEVNLSCPNLKHGMTVSYDPVLVADFVSAAAGNGCPVWAKVSPMSPDLLASVSAAVESGADAVVVANTFPATAVDWRASKPLIGFGTGGLSGPAVKPLALYNVALVSSRTNVPVVASGGAFCAEDVLEFLSAGAICVQVGTANLVDPAGVCGIPEEIVKLLKEEGKESVGEVVGSTTVFRASRSGDPEGK